MAVSEKNERRRAGRGYTLIELMVAVAIIAAMAAFAGPKLLRMTRRMSLAGSMRTLYAGFQDAQSRARTTGIKHRLELDKVNDVFRIYSYQDLTHPLVVTKIDDSGRFRFRQDGYPDPFPPPYGSVPRDAWCTFCGKGNPTGYIQFDGEGLLEDATVSSPTRGSISLYDSSGSTDAVESLVFIGRTGDVRLFSRGY